jgi:iron(III) transport system ATP-binding protein
MSTAVRVEARDVALAFGKTAVLKNINLVIEPGEFFTLLGPSGCGKSTLLRLIAGFNRAQRGAILVDGKDVTAVPPWKRDVGMVFQSYALWPHLTVAQNVAFGLEERRLPRDEIRRKTGNALDLVGLGALAERSPHQLSGGQQQRVALARTLAIEPRVLLLDEPLSNLDAKLRVHMRHELGQLQRRLGITTIFVTHDQEEALTTSDRVAVMHQGVIQQIGTPMDLFDRPANRFVAEFVGTINVISGTLQKSIGETVLFVSPQAGSFALPRTEEMPDHGVVTLAFRPHSLTLAETAGGGTRIWLDATVEAREFLGEFVRYRVRVGGTEIIADQMHFGGTPVYAAGKRVQVGLDPPQIKIFREEAEATVAPARAAAGNS